MNDSTAGSHSDRYGYYAHAPLVSYLGQLHAQNAAQKKRKKNVHRNAADLPISKLVSKRVMSESAWGSSRPGHAGIHEKLGGGKNENTTLGAWRC